MRTQEQHIEEQSAQNFAKESVHLSEPLRLTPMVASHINQYFKTNKLFELTQALGSPLNVLFPSQIEKNLNSFEAVLKKHNLRGKIFFAHKSNRADCIPRYLATTTAHIDVSSTNELRHALSCGFESNRIQATGPKNQEFINLCVQHSVTVAIDNLPELQQLIEVKTRTNNKKVLQILLRVSGFKNRQTKHQGKASRFGIKYEDIANALRLVAQNRKLLNLLGFSFHLDTVSALEKVVAAEGCLNLIEEAFDMDLEPRVLNIGGGFKASYLANSEHWNKFQSAMREAALGARAPLTWQGNTFGLIPDKGNLRGSFNSYNFFDSITGADFLDELISHPLDFAETMGSPNTDTLASFLATNDIELWVEPGRALVDQLGITVAKVNAIKESSTGDTLIILDMKRQDVCFLDQEIFVDPIILYSKNELLKSDEIDLGEQQPKTYAVYFAGNLCLESDLITRHQTVLDKMPEPGDLVAFVNTAGYFMDFSASESIMQKTALKIAVFEQDGDFAWALDENYYPWL